MWWHYVVGFVVFVGIIVLNALIVTAAGMKHEALSPEKK